MKASQLLSLGAVTGILAGTAFAQSRAAADSRRVAPLQGMSHRRPDIVR